VTDLEQVRHVVLDMDGTLYSGARLFAETIPFLERLRSLGIGYTFLTNNTSRSKADYVTKLRKLGIEAREDEIYTPAESTITYLRTSLPRVKAIALMGTPSLEHEFTEAGFAVNWDAPEAVVVGFDTTVTYERLCRTAYWISRGLPFLATHPDFVCPTSEPTVLVDCGSLCACLGPDRDLRGNPRQQKAALTYMMAVIDQMVVLDCLSLIGPVYSSVGRAEAVVVAANRGDRRDFA